PAGAVAAGVGIGHEALARAGAGLVGDVARVSGDDLPRAGGLEDLRGAVEPRPDVGDVCRRQPVADDRLAAAAEADLTRPVVAEQHADEARVTDPAGELAVLRRASPGRERGEEARVERRRLVLDAVAAVEVAELVGVDRLHRPLPRPHLLLEEPEDAGR